MDINNESEFSVDEISKETLKVLRIGGKQLILYIVLAAAALAGLVGFMIYALSIGKKVTDLIVLVICIVIILLMLLYFELGYPKTIKKQYEKNFGSHIKFNYVFHINRVSVESTSDITSSKGTFTYESMYKIVEGPNTIRLYIAKRNFLPVKKSGFSESDYKKIMQVLQEAKVKYKVSKK